MSNAWGDSWEQQDEVNAETLIALKTLSDKVDQQALLLQKLAVEVKVARQPDLLIALGLHRHSWQQTSFYIVIGTVIFAAVVLGIFAMRLVREKKLIQGMVNTMEPFIVTKVSQKEAS